MRAADSPFLRPWLAQAGSAPGQTRAIQVPGVDPGARQREAEAEARADSMRQLLGQHGEQARAVCQLEGLMAELGHTQARAEELRQARALLATTEAEIDRLSNLNQP